MAAKTQLSVKQGATYIVPFTADDGPGTDYTGWKVYFIVKKTMQTANLDALINVGPLTVDPVTGRCSVTFTDETTANWPVGSYIYQGVLVDAAGNVAKTDNGEFIVQNSAYQGAIA